MSRVLIVDDEEGYCKYMSQYLKHEGHACPTRRLFCPFSACFMGEVIHQMFF